MIEWRDVHKAFGGQPILRGLPLRVERGEVLYIIGTSGVGKSVTIKHLIGLVRPDAGTIWVDGARVDALRMCGVDPVRYLVVPRFLASVIMTPVLTILAIAVAMLAGMLTAHLSFHVNPAVFLDASHVRFGDVALGLIKSLCYGAAIPVVAGACGLRARGGSEGVGQATTRAVIGASFAVILLDFALSGVGYFTLQGGRS